MEKWLPSFRVRFCAGLVRRLMTVLMCCLLAGGCSSFNNKHSSNRDQSLEEDLPFYKENQRLPFPGYQNWAFRSGIQSEKIVVSYSDYRDPLIGLNRIFFKFNDVAYRFLLIPIAKGYTRIVPDSVERCIGNFFYNIKSPIYAVNHLLQGKPKSAGRTVLRFGINTTIGILGFFDPARTRYAIEKEETHFENTLAHYGAGYGFYLVIPIFGPSDLRHGVSALADYFLNPISYLTEFPVSTLIEGYDNFQVFAPGAKHYLTLRRESKDAYTFFRNLYLQGVQRDEDY